MTDRIQLTGEDFFVVLTGAGISAESGVKTFRDNGGLWEDHRVEDVATPEAFRRDPGLVWRFYEQRRRQLREVSPNPAHKALAALEERLGPQRFLLITQNVDDLHERGGSRNLVHMHGELLKVRCVLCRAVIHTDTDLLNEDGRLPECACGGMLRPHIVWFGEIPFEMERIQQAVNRCTHFLSIGTSGVVYPAAGLLQLARMARAVTWGFNLEPPENSALFDNFYQGRAGELLPQWIADLEIWD